MMSSKHLAPTVIPYTPSPAFLKVDKMVRLAESYGWPRRWGFHVSMQLVALGATVEEAERLFADCGERVQ